ncbi:MAG: lipocalin-like domain-containing protein [Xanthobacteraceae bacterium]
MSAQPSGEIAGRFFGAWRYAGTTIDGQPRADRGDPCGIIIYDPSGHMAVQIMPGREHVATAPASTFICYFGRWSIDEQARTVTHHREGDLRADGEINAVRQYEFTGDRLILRPVGKDQQIMWERIR